MKKYEETGSENQFNRKYGDDTVNLLINECHVDVCATDDKNSTSLHYVCGYGHPDMATLILDTLIDTQNESVIYACDDDGNDPLFYLCCRRYLFNENGWATIVEKMINECVYPDDLRIRAHAKAVENRYELLAGILKKYDDEKEEKGDDEDEMEIVCV